MENWIQNEFAVASAKDPPYVPYLTPKLFEPPWAPIDTDRKTARTRRIGYSEQARRTLIPQEMSIQAFSLYSLRFVISADLCKAWSSFGGLGPQLSHLSTVLHLAIAESVGPAFPYHRLVANKLQEKARKRSTQASDFVSLLSVGNFTLKEQAKKEAHVAIESDLRTRTQPGKGKGNGNRSLVLEANDRSRNDRSQADETQQQDRQRSRTPQHQRNNFTRRDNRDNRDNRDTRNTQQTETRYGPNNRKGQKGNGRNNFRR